MSVDTDEIIEPALQIIASRSANEGVPIGAIARILQKPYGLVHEHLKIATGNGAVGTMPKADWPPSQHSDARLPTAPRTANSDDIEFACRLKFKLTPLETAFLVVLLRYTHCEKEKLHSVVETQRATRQFRPDKLECTELKMVDVIICKLRAKLKDVDEKLVISTVWGKGYYIDPAVKTAIYSIIGAPHAFDVTVADSQPAS
jgi:hypothetical protein